MGSRLNNIEKRKQVDYKPKYVNKLVVIKRAGEAGSVIAPIEVKTTDYSLVTNWEEEKPVKKIGKKKKEEDAIEEPSVSEIEEINEQN